MRTALCISGELRRVKLFYPAIKKHILDPYQPDVFISTWDMPAGIATSKANTHRDPTEMATMEEVVDMFKPVGTYTQQYSLDIKRNLTSYGNTPHDNLMCMSYHILQSITLATHRAMLLGCNYDLVIRYRFDYAIRIKFEDYDLTRINIPEEHAYGGYQDQFAFGNMKVMAIYGTWFHYLPHMENYLAQSKGLSTNQTNTPGMPWHPESALKRYLTSVTAPIHLIQNVEIRYPWCTQEEIEVLYD